MAQGLNSADFLVYGHAPTNVNSYALTSRWHFVQFEIIILLVVYSINNHSVIIQKFKFSCFHVVSYNATRRDGRLSPSI